MKKGIYGIWVMLLVLFSCRDNDINLFDKTPEERASEAIAGLKSDLVAPANGWKLKYKPVDNSGSFFLLMDFNEDNTVTIKSDLGSNDGEFYEQTLTYRIDNSLGLELIFESYSFFSFLFEQDNASFEAEFEFKYVNKTPDDALVFRSKTDTSNPTILLFEEAAANDDQLLGIEVADNLNLIAGDISRFSSVYSLTYDNKDLVLYLSLDPFKRIVNITTAARKTNSANTKVIDFTAGYLVLKDSIVFDTPLTGSILGSNITLKSIRLDDLSDITLDGICAAPIPTHSYDGVTSKNEGVVLEPTIVDANGKRFAQASTFFSTPIHNVFHNGESVEADIAEKLTGAVQMQLYYIPGASGLYGLGFFLQNADGTRTFALREFTPTLINNNIVFNFEDDITLFENTDPDADINNVNIYLDALTEGNHTYVYEYSEGIYEFHNPCSGWSVVFFAN